MEQQTSPKKNFTSRIVRLAKNDVVQMTALMTAVAVVSAGLSREITLRQAFSSSFASILILDEATSALDEETEELMYSLIKTSLPRSVIVSVGHRSTIAKWHNQTLDFNNLAA